MLSILPWIYLIRGKSSLILLFHRFWAPRSWISEKWKYVWTQFFYHRRLSTNELLKVPFNIFILFCEHSLNQIKPFSMRIKILFVKRNARVKFYPYEWPRCIINLILKILFPEERSFLISRIFLLDWKVHALMTVPANQNGFIALSPR